MILRSQHGIKPSCLVLDQSAGLDPCRVMERNGLGCGWAHTCCANSGLPLWHGEPDCSSVTVDVGRKEIGCFGNPWPLQLLSLTPCWSPILSSLGLLPAACQPHISECPFSCSGVRVYLTGLGDVAATLPSCEEMLSRAHHCPFCFCPDHTFPVQESWELPPPPPPPQGCLGSCLHSLYPLTALPCEGQFLCQRHIWRMGPIFIMEGLMDELHLSMMWESQNLAAVTWRGPVLVFGKPPVIQRDRDLCPCNTRNENGSLTWGLNAQKPEAGGSLQIRGQSGLHSEF